MTWSWSDLDVAVPRPADRLPGISMAGFGLRAGANVAVEIAMVAHPSLTLIVDLSADGDLAWDADGSRCHGSFAAGLLPGPVRAGGRQGACLQIRLSPPVAAAMLGGSAELTGTVAGLDDVLGREADRLRDRMLTAGSWDERFAIATRVLGARLEERRPVAPEVAHTWRLAVASHGRVRVEGLAEEVGWSRKRLWSRCRSQLGVSPKRAAQLVRFDRAAHLLAAGRPAASVAAHCGYADQPHLSREVKAFTGGTPAALAAAPWLAIDDVAWPGVAGI